MNKICIYNIRVCKDLCYILRKHWFNTFISLKKIKQGRNDACPTMPCNQVQETQMLY